MPSEADFDLPVEGFKGAREGVAADVSRRRSAFLRKNAPTEVSGYREWSRDRACSLRREDLPLRPHAALGES